MVIIRYLEENGNQIEPLTHDECITLWNHCYRNSMCPDGSVDCKLVELGTFGSCRSPLNSNSDNSGGSSKLIPFSLLFSRETRR